MIPTNELFSLLKKICRVKIAVHSARGSNSSLGSAYGNVTVVSESLDLLRLEERGILEIPNSRTRTNFSNALRLLSIDSNSFQLFHLRREAPVALGEFNYSSGIWQMNSPHVCGEDLYRAQLWQDQQTLTLRWEISGKKDQIIEATYS